MLPDLGETALRRARNRYRARGELAAQRFADYGVHVDREVVVR
jgi:hypothetical protein